MLTALPLAVELGVPVAAESAGCVSTGANEQLTLQMLLATYQHHAVPRGQTTARSGGVGERVELHGDVLEDPLLPPPPPPQAAGAQFFATDVDEVPAAGGSKPDRLAPVSGPQERVLRHFVQQLVEPVRGVPAGDHRQPINTGQG